MNNLIWNDTYRIESVRLTGLKHIRSFQPCQDSVSTELLNGGAILAVADGHGHRMHYLSEKGSCIACDSAAEVLRNVLTEGSLSNRTEAIERRHIANMISSAWREKVISDFSERCTIPKSASARDMVYTAYGTTLLYAAVDGDYALLGQLGDGAAVVRMNDGSMIMPLREKRESQHPDSLCNEESGSLFRTVALPVCDIDSILLCTDGEVNRYEDQTHFLEAMAQKLRKKELNISDGAYDDASTAAMWMKRGNASVDAA